MGPKTLNDALWTLFYPPAHEKKLEGRVHTLEERTHARSDIYGAIMDVLIDHEGEWLSTREIAAIMQRYGDNVYQALRQRRSTNLHKDDPDFEHRKERVTDHTKGKNISYNTMYFRITPTGIKRRKQEL